MRARPLFLIATILIGSLMSSCNTDKDDDDDFRTPPNLTATVNVTGAITDSFTFTNSENDEDGGAQALHGTHSGADNMIVMSGSGVNSVYTMTATLSAIQTGAFSLTQGSYLNTAGAQPKVFEELGSGSFTITDVKLLWTQGVSQFYSIDGTWSMQLEDGESPAETITLTCSFDNLVIVSIP